MSIQSEIERINSNVQESLSICADNGVEVASDANSDDLPAAVSALAASAGSGSSNITFATEEPAEDDGADGELRLVYTPVEEQEVETPLLPDGYTELTYIESSGSQYIDTGFKPTSEKLTIACDMEYTASANSTSAFGSESNSQYSIVPYGVNGDIYIATSKKLVSLAPTVNTRYSMEFVADNSAFSWDINGTIMSATYTGELLKSYSIYIFANNKAGTAAQLCTMRLYAFKIYDNGTLVRDFVPCMNADGEVGLYDLVNSVFYGDAAGGAFTAGDTITYNTEYDTSGEGFFKKNGQWYTVGKAMTTAQIRAICT